MKSDKKKSSQNACELPSEGGQDNIDATSNVTQSPFSVKHKSKVSRLIDMAITGKLPGEEYRMYCPRCGSPELSFNPKKWVFFCYSCELGRHQNLSNLFELVGIK